MFAFSQVGFCKPQARKSLVKHHCQSISLKSLNHHRFILTDDLKLVKKPWSQLESSKRKHHNLFETKRKKEELQGLAWQGPLLLVASVNTNESSIMSWILSNDFFPSKMFCYVVHIWDGKETCPTRKTRAFCNSYFSAQLS